MNAPPEPFVSGRYFLPVAPLWWRNRMPACCVTSVNSTGENLGGSDGAAEGDGEAVETGAVAVSVGGEFLPASSCGCRLRQAVSPARAAMMMMVVKRRRRLLIAGGMITGGGAIGE